MSKAITPQKPKDETPQRGPRQGSTIWAAMEVLRGKRKPMTTAEIRERKLAPGLKGKTPEQTLAAQLAVNAKQGRYVERVERGKFRLKPSALMRTPDRGRELAALWAYQGMSPEASGAAVRLHIPDRGSN